MAVRGNSLLIALALILIVAGGCAASARMVGGWEKADPSSADVVSAAKFAVSEHNKQLDGKSRRLDFSRLLSAQSKVVSGIMYKLVLEASEAGGGKATYEAQVWVKAWQHFQKLVEFKPIG